MCEDVDWIQVTAIQRYIVNTAINLRVSKNNGELLDQLNDFQLLNMDFALWS
jgi:hypothetical protein